MNLGTKDGVKVEKNVLIIGGCQTHFSIKCNLYDTDDKLRLESTIIIIGNQKKCYVRHWTVSRLSNQRKYFVFDILYHQIF